MSNLRRWGTVLLTVVAFAALFLSTYSVVQYTRQQAQRERERVASDVQGCERGNDLRRTIVQIGNADAAMVQGILDVFFAPNERSTPERDALIAQLRASLEPLFAEHQAALDQVKTVDCQALVPGA